MGNLIIKELNGIDIENGFVRYHGTITGGNLLSICNKSGTWRIFNCDEGYPPDSISQDNDCFVNAYIAEDNRFVRLQVLNIRNSNVWEILCIAGEWKKYELLPNNFQIQEKLDFKVDKEEGKQLSDENYTLVEKQKVANMTSHFRGYFQNSSSLSTIENPVKGDFAIVGATEPSIWVYNGSTFVDTMGKMFGDMLKSIYSPTTTGDLADRNNHHGQQQMSTIVGLQESINSKLDKIDKTKVIDNCESKNPMDALSANMGNMLRDRYIRLASGLDKIDYGHYFGETGGYIKTGSGLIIQFGQVKTTSTTATQDFVFPISFSTKVYGIFATCVGASASGSGVDGVYAKVVDLTKGSITHDYKNVSTTELLHYVLAIGY